MYELITCRKDTGQQQWRCGYWYISPL